MIKFPKYFDEYGGLNAVVKSKYFFFAFLTTAMISRYFATPYWWELSIAVVPGLVGFSIAGVAIFVSLGSDSLRSVVAGKRPGSNNSSSFMSFMAMFTHFIVVQLLALLFAFIAKALYEAKPIQENLLYAVAESLKEPFWVLGGLLLIYALFLCVALAVEIYRLAAMIDDYQTVENEIAAAEAATKQSASN
jgi:hypothetical protein